VPAVLETVLAGLGMLALVYLLIVCMVGFLKSRD